MLYLPLIYSLLFFRVALIFQSGPNLKYKGLKMVDLIFHESGWPDFRGGKGADTSSVLKWDTR